MKIFRGFNDLPEIPSPVVSVGSFDGVHRGHRLLIARLNELARQNGGESVVVTFDPHPRKFLRGTNRLLTTLDEKLILLEESGLQNVIIVEFNDEFSRIGAGDFTREYLQGILKAHTVVSGEGHHFGHNRSGDHRMMERAGIDNQQLSRYDNISSTVIRDAIEQGNMSRAAEMLSGGYMILSPVTDESKLLPPPGNYLVSADGDIPHVRYIDRDALDKIHGQLRILGE